MATALAEMPAAERASYILMAKVRVRVRVRVSWFAAERASYILMAKSEGEG